MDYRKIIIVGENNIGRSFMAECILRGILQKRNCQNISADLVLAITKGLAEEIKESFDEATSCMSIGTFIDTTETEERIPEVTEENQETYQTCFDILEPLMEAVADRIIGELLV